MPTEYDKPFRPVPEQIRLLEDRGMIITDPVAASKCLQRIGYYRLSGYFYPFRRRINGRDHRSDKTEIVEDDFQTGTNFSTVIDLYVFDKGLRLLALDALERIEVALRVEIALMLGARSKTAHREPEQVDTSFWTPKSGIILHANWIERLDQVVGKSKEEFVKHFRRTYHPPL